MRTRASIASLLSAALACLLLGPGAARATVAAACDGVSFPPTLQVRGTTLRLNGLGLRKATIFGIKVYVAALYLAHPSGDAQAILDSSEPQEMQLRFVFHVTAGQLRDAWREGFAKNAPTQLSQLHDRIAQLEGWMSGVGSGQSMTFVRIPHLGIEYALDGVVRGTIPGDDFAKAFLAIWLGRSPPSAALQAGLLGGACR
jgi:hypothetical protein